ncbi:hypothetical protein KC887_08670 [Candidatus Kaiserbacteria bacterium]|nr:hypothetical protein [Candidatus Kaiserbacteria bacterium]
MKITVAEYLGILASFALLAIGAVLFDLGVFGTALLLVVIPVVWLWMQLHPPLSLVAIIAVFAVGSTLIFEAIAASNGLWYSVPDVDMLLFGVVPVELFFATFVFNAFALLLYEFFVDDRSFDEPRSHKHYRWLLFFALSTTIIGVLSAVMLHGVVMPFAFAALLMVVVGTLGLVVWLSHSASRVLARKALLGAGLLFPFYVIHELVALFNTQVVYANPGQYLYYIPLLGNDWPIEKLVFFIAVPLWLIVVYEVYLDDGE